MIQPTPVGSAVLAVCMLHYQFWIVSEDRSTCLLCGGPPTHALEVPPVGAAAVPATAEPEAADWQGTEPISIAVKCPHCDADVDLLVTEDGISVAMPEPAPAAPEHPLGPEAVRKTAEAEAAEAEAEA